METTFHVLGPVAVERPGEVLQLGGPRQMAVLAALLIEPGRVVSTSRLIDFVWGDEPPARPETSLRAYISNLRRIIEPDRDGGPQLLLTAAPGYRIDIRASQIDSVQFERLSDLGFQQRETDPRSAVETLGQSLDLFRGTPFETLDRFPAFAPHRRRLQQLRLSVEEARFEARLALGDHDKIRSGLERLIAANPYRERAVELLMIAHYRSGLQQEALTAFTRLRERLGENLGLDPSVSICELETRIIQQDSSLLQPAPLLQTASRLQNAASPAHRGVQPPNTDSTLRPPPGRTGSVAVIEHGLDQLQSRSSSILALVGEPGIGKTTLAHHAAASAQRRGITAVWGRCLSGSGDSVLWPWTQILSDLVEFGSDGQIRAWVDDDPELARISPRIARAFDTEPNPTDTRLPLFEAMRNFLKRRSQDDPLLIVLEDLHWADAASVDLLVFVASALADEAVAFVATWRDTEDAGVASAPLAELASLPQLVLPELHAFSADDVLEVMTESGREADLNLAQSIVARTGGNPFFISEFLQLDASDKPAEVGVISPGLVKTIEHRVAGCGKDATALLTVASLISGSFSPRTLSRATGIDTDLVTAALETAMRAGLIEDDPERNGRLRFHHALVAETLAAELSGMRRSQLHADIGSALRTEGASDAVLANHFAEGAPAGTAELAVEYGIAASQHAGRLFDIPLAVDLLERSLQALELAEEPDLSLASDIQVHIGQCFKQSGDYEKSHERFLKAFELAIEANDLDAMCHAVGGFCGRSARGALFPSVQWLGYWNPSETAIRISQDALARLPENDPRRVGLLSQLGSNRFGELGDDERGVTEIRQARALAEAVGVEPVIELEVLFNLQEGLNRFGDADEQIELATEAQTIALEAGLNAEWFRGQRVLVMNALDRGDQAAVDRLFLEGRSRALESPDHLSRMEFDWLDVSLTMYAGDLAKADRLIDDGFSRYSRFGAASLDAFGLQTAALRREQGQFHDVEALLRMKLASYEGPAFTGPLAMTLAEMGRTEEADALMDSMSDNDLASGGEAALQFLTPANFAAAAALTGNQRAANVLYELFNDLPTRVITLNTGMLIVDSTRLVSGALARSLGREAEAADHLDEAEHHFLALSAQPSLVRTMRERAALHRAAGRAQDAQQQEDAAAALATEIGHGWYDVVSPVRV